MRKAFSWNWIINGLVIGIVVIGIFFGIMGRMFNENARQDAREALSDIKTAGNNLCIAGEGDETYLKIDVPDNVIGIYVSNDEEGYASNIDEKVKNGVVDVGKYLCMKFRDEAPYCQQLECEVQMNNVGPKETVLSIADRIINKPHKQTLELFFSKGECGSSILLEDTDPAVRENACVSNSCDYEVIMGCNREPAMVLVDGRALVMGDTTPFCQGTGGCYVDDATVDFSVNVAQNFSGSKNSMLIIWEDLRMNPASAGFTQFMANMSTVTNVVTRRHEDGSGITTALLAGYDQVWIFRPGWCYGQSTDGDERISSTQCQNVKEWDSGEIQAISDYFDSGGRIFLTSDYSSIDDESYKSVMNIKQDINYPQDTVPNRILKAIDEDLYFERSGCLCGCKTKSATNYASSPLVEGVSDFKFDAATRILCE